MKLGGGEGEGRDNKSVRVRKEKVVAITRPHLSDRHAGATRESAAFHRVAPLSRGGPTLSSWEPPSSHCWLPCTQMER